MANPDTITTVDLSSHNIPRLATGKVREIFRVDDDTLLFVATDRISAFDVVLTNGIPHKGALLTQLSAHWFALIRSKLPHLQTHLLSTALPPSIPESDSTLRKVLQKRSMQVRRLQIIPLESIVRGYITGSAWAEYKSHGTVHGMAVPAGLEESERFARPIWTPSTKAEAGEHDQNISREEAVKLVGEEVARKVEEASLAVYEMARDYAAERGIIIADTKFEFGLDEATGEVVLADEVLTPDSSRFWPAADYKVGRGQQSYDKQYLRDWLINSGLKGKEGTAMPGDIAKETSRKYQEAYESLTGKKWEVGG